MSPEEVGYITENPCDDCNKINCCLFGGPSCLEKINPCHPDCILTLFPWPWKRRAAGCGECQSCRDCRPAVAARQVAARQVAARQVPEGQAAEGQAAEGQVAEGQVAAKTARAKTAAAQTPARK
jgi:hypothetical protein